MSAFVVSNKHLVSLINFAADKDIRFYLDTNNDGNQRSLDPSDWDDAQLLCEILFKQNVRSVLERYPRDSIKDYPMTVDYTQEEGIVISPIQAVKACQCYDYQACETADWMETNAWRITQNILGYAISLLQGYALAAWEIR